MRILVLLNFVPYPLTSGAQLRAYHLIKRMAAQHQVWLGVHVRSEEEAQNAAVLRAFCQDVVMGRLVRAHPLQHVPGLVRYGLQGKPFELKFKWSPSLADQIHRLCETEDFDVVVFEETAMAPYVEVMPPARRARHVLTFYDIDYLQAGRIAQHTSHWALKIRASLYGLVARRWEPHYAERFDCCITVSDVDRCRLATVNPRLRKIAVVPNGVDTHAYQPLPEAEGPPALIFVGSMEFAPCIDAMTYFHRAIWPLVQKAVPDVTLWIVGRNPAAEVRALEGDGVHVTGRVEDIVPYYQQATVVVVPLRSGGGTRLKILEAMALGRPVVSTSIGYEGLDVVPGEHLLAEDQPAKFAEGVIRLLGDRELRERLVVKARARVEALYEWDQIAASQLALFESLVDGHFGKGP